MALESVELSYSEEQANFDAWPDYIDICYVSHVCVCVRVVELLLCLIKYKFIENFIVSFYCINSNI